MAKLYFRYGAMNSGKSTALMQVAHNYEEQGMKVLILKPQVDTKGGGELVSRLGVRRKADLLIPPELDVFEAVQAANAASGPLACVLCDESQFFTPEQAEQLFMITVDLNIPVICYGLRADFSLKGFPGSTRLLELAHTIEEMKTICTCGRKAICNCRKVNGRFVFEGEQVAIDLENDVQYVSMCPQCYFKARRAFYAAKKNSERSIYGYKPLYRAGCSGFFAWIKPSQSRLTPCQILPFVTYGDIFPRSGGSRPSRGRLYAMPETLPPPPKSSPLGEGGCERSEQMEGVSPP